MSDIEGPVERFVLRLVRPRGRQRGVVVRADLPALFFFQLIWMAVVAVLLWLPSFLESAGTSPSQGQAHAQERAGR